MTPLRKRMLDDLMVRNYSENTIEAYLDAVAHFAAYFGRSPGLLGPEHIREYQNHLVNHKKLRFSSLNVIVCGLRFFYRVTMGEQFDIKLIPFARPAKRLPAVLSLEEMRRFLAAIDFPKHHAIFTTMYASGLRISEATNLRVEDVDSSRMVLRVQQGKGQKDRYTLLSPRLLETLRNYARRSRPDSWLFYGRTRSAPLTVETLQKPIRLFAARAGIKKAVTSHTMRHSFATHLLEAGTNLETIRRLMGHKSLRTTQIYLHVANKAIQSTKSPLDLLDLASTEHATDQADEPSSV